MGVSGGGVCGWECVYEVWVVWVVVLYVVGMCCDVCVCGWVVL